MVTAPISQMRIEHRAGEAGLGQHSPARVSPCRYPEAVSYGSYLPQAASAWSSRAASP